jgi:DNA repair protein RecO (recombination protein O)
MLIEAIVIKKTPAREHDYLVTLYSREQGKMSALAKGAMKSHSVQGLQLDPGNVVHCELVPGRTGMAIMTGTQAVNCFSGLKSTPASWAAAQFFLQVVDTAVFDHEPDEGLWSCLTGILTGLNGGDRQSLLADFRQHQSELLAVLGYGSPSLPVGAVSGRTELDDTFERLADRKLQSIDLFYELAR